MSDANALWVRGDAVGIDSDSAESPPLTTTCGMD